MNDAVEIVIGAGGAAWELAVVRALQSPSYGVRVARRCVDVGELAGTALRDRPAAVVIDASLPWVDRDFVVEMRRSGVGVIEIGRAAGARADVGVVSLPVDFTVDDLVAAVLTIDVPRALTSETTADRDDMVSAPTSGRAVVVWGGAGSPGRTTVAVHLAVEAARAGRGVVLIDADVWAPSIAQLVEVGEAPSIAQAAVAGAAGWETPFESFLQDGPDGVRVLAGLPRAELWPELREQAWRAVLAAARTEFDLVVVDVAAPIEEDEDLVADRIPYRRNLVTTIALELADDVVFVAAADPVALRRGVIAHRTLMTTTDRPPSFVVLNRAPRAGRRLQECSRAVSDWMDVAPAAFLPDEPELDRTVWEGRTLQTVAPRSRWLRELRSLVPEVIA